MFFCILVLGVFVRVYPTKGERWLNRHSSSFKFLVSSKKNIVLLGKNSMFWRFHNSFFVLMVVNNLFYIIEISTWFLLKKMRSIFNKFNVFISFNFGIYFVDKVICLSRLRSDPSSWWML